MLVNQAALDQHFGIGHERTLAGVITSYSIHYTKLYEDCIPKVFIPATDECPTLSEIVKFAGEVGCILAYAYLGDVTSSVTGDKKAQKFEDDYLDELFEVIDKAGIRVITSYSIHYTKLYD